MASKKNKWRRIGKSGIEVCRETARYYDNSPRGDNLWFRTAKGTSACGTGRRVAWVYKPTGEVAVLGLGVYLPMGASGPVAMAHAIRHYLKD